MAANKIILIVEDDEVLLRALSLQLRGPDITLATATDGETAIQVAERVIPDIILLDLILPKKDGFEVLKVLNSSRKLKDIPVIVLSNLGAEDDVSRAKNLGAKDYFVKSDVDLEDVSQKISTYLK